MKLENTEKLTEWIKKRISEICDAEPVAFAKYVVALLKKDDSEDKLRSICCDQLAVFLAEGTDDFVNNLFETLGSRSYLRENEKSPSPPVEKSVDASSDLDSHTKGSSENTRTARRRISPPRESKEEPRPAKESAVRTTAERRPYNSRDRERRSRSRSPYASRRRPFGSCRSRSSSSPAYRRDHHRRERPDRVAPSQQQRRTRCPEYEEQGFCRQGVKCQYEHGPEAIVVDEKNVDFRPEFNGNAPPPGHDQGARPTTTGSTMYVPAPSVQPEPYNPEAPALTGGPIPPGFVPNFSIPPPPMGLTPGVGMMPVNPYLPPPQMMSAQMGPMRGGMGFRGFGRGRGRGRFGHFSERVQPNKSTTLEVRRIPPEVNKLGIINNHFTQFGDITNIQISFDGSPDTALVTYAKLPDAQAAMKSQKPILDNRFIQVSWHKPPPPTPAVDPNAPQSANGNALGSFQPVIPLSLEANSAIDKKPVGQLPQTETARQAAKIAEENMQQRRKERKRVTHLQEVYVLKGKLYEKQVAELKTLFERMSKITDPKAKSQFAQLVKALEQTMKTTTNELHEVHSELQQLKSKQKRPASDDDEPTEKPAQKKRAESTGSIDSVAAAKVSDVKEEENDEKSEVTDTSQHSELADEHTIRKLLQESDDDEAEEEQPKHAKQES